MEDHVGEGVPNQSDPLMFVKGSPSHGMFMLNSVAGTDHMHDTFHKNKEGGSQHICITD